MPRAFLLTNKRYVKEGQGTTDYDRKWQENDRNGWLVDLYKLWPKHSSLKKNNDTINSFTTPEFSPRKFEVADFSLSPSSQHSEEATLPTSTPASSPTNDALNQSIVLDLSIKLNSDSPPEQIDGQHQCSDCGKRYSTSSNLARHRQVHRSIDDRKARTCPHCAKVYVSMPAFSMHVRTHVQGCACSLCGKTFSRPWLLQGHLRTHTGEKPFKCEKCKKAFADKSNLRAHVQTHSTEKPFTCVRCYKSFALKSYLYKHEESSCLRNSRTIEK